MLPQLLYYVNLFGWMEILGISGEDSIY